MTLKQAIKLQLKIMINKKNFIFSFTFMMLYCLTVYVLNVLVNRNMDISATLSASSLYVGNDLGDYYYYLNIFFLFIVIFPFSFSHFDDKRSKMGFLLQTRMGNRNYYLSQMLVCFLGSFAILFIPFFINAILTDLTFLETGYTHYGNIYATNFCNALLGNKITINAVSVGMPFLKFYLYHPLLYNLLYALFIGLFSGLIGIFSLACSFYIRKYKLILFLINYLLFYIANTCDIILMNSPKYLDTIFLDYVTVNSTMGKSPWYILMIGLLLLAFSLLSMKRFIRTDKL